MSNFSVIFDRKGLNKARKRLDDLPREIQEGYIEEVAEKVVDEFREEEPVDTGDLRDSTYADVNGIEMDLIIEEEYAEHLLNGTKHMDADEFDKRAFDNLFDEKEDILDEVTRRIEL